MEKEETIKTEQQTKEKVKKFKFNLSQKQQRIVFAVLAVLCILRIFVCNYSKNIAK